MDFFRNGGLWILVESGDKHRRRESSEYSQKKGTTFSHVSTPGVETYHIHASAPDSCSRTEGV